MTIISATLLLAFSTAMTVTMPQLSKDAALAKAEAILKNLQDGKIGDITKEFDERMAQDAPEAKLKPAWSGLVSQFGAFKAVTERREGQVKGRQAVELFLAFEKETIVQRVVFDDNGRIAGLVFRPVSGSLLPPAKEIR